jgi:hypothetical protein
MEERQIRIAAQWIYQNRKGPDWWSCLVLTEHNPNGPTPHLSYQDASRVFQALEDKLLLKTIETIELPGGHSIPKYEFNFGKLSEWKEYTQLNWFQKTLPGWVLQFISFWRILLVASAILIVTSFLQSFVGKFGEALFEWLKKKI